MKELWRKNWPYLLPFVFFNWLFWTTANEFDATRAYIGMWGTAILFAISIKRCSK